MLVNHIFQFLLGLESSILGHAQAHKPTFEKRQPLLNTKHGEDCEDVIWPSWLAISFTTTKKLWV